VAGLPQTAKFTGILHNPYVGGMRLPVACASVWELLMRRFSSLLISAVSVVAVTQIASAADMPVKAPVAPVAPVAIPYNWTGFYVGGHVGYFWGRTHVEEDGEVVEDGAPTNGVIGGVLAGYNWQNGPLVLGLEGDFGWTNANGTGGGTPAPPPVIVTVTQAPNTYDLNWTSHVRGRLGYAADRWLFFVAGGLAIADFEFHEGAITTTTTTIPGGTYVGWSIGGGVEYAFTRNLIGRVEYLYDNFGHKDYTGVDGDPYRVSLTGQTLRGALAWKF
jgi:outer membrane immunogenic protein